ncbi:MAG: nucleoside-diphosphate sugar epimerase/dehydratase [Chloroflexi bacterium]|nr:nucleoside-diphosphate sugar epimerase/dehydratase [Chloroflexota bacterium]
MLVVGGGRFSVRLAMRLYRQRWVNGRRPESPPQPVLIMGAGDAGAMIVRELQNNPHLGLEPVGFLDDDLGKHDVKIHGVPVLGDRHAIPAAVKKHQVGQVIIAMPTARGAEIRDIVRICGEAGVQARIIPGIYELLDGSVSINQLRDVRIEDLLRREPVRTDTSAVSGMLRGKRVLVTGAGGSIGSELCRQIVRCEPAELVLVGHGENSIFEIANELQTANPQTANPQSANLQTANLQIANPQYAVRNAQHAVRITPVIADIRFAERIRAVFEVYRPEIVFHAGAHKHVPLMESNEVEAITNNVLGTRNVVEAAVATGVVRFLMISTDKAVNPTSVMGASKRVAEIVVTHAGRARGSGDDGPPAPLPLAPLPLCTVVRFGNVLGSRGSVVPFFQRQIAAGGPVTVTHPDMRRYFMTIPEAVQLVLQAAVIGKGGQVFALDMGEPVRIADLACDLIRLSGLRPHVREGDEETRRGAAGEDWDIEVVYTGLRPGEKLFEELFLENEDYSRTQHEKIFVCRNGAEHVEERWQVEVDALVAAAQRGVAGEVRRLLHEVVPEYRGDTVTG